MHEGGSLQFEKIKFVEKHQKEIWILISENCNKQDFGNYHHILVA